MAVADDTLTEVISVRNQLMVMHPVTRKLVPAPAGSKIGEKVAPPALAQEDTPYPSSEDMVWESIIFTRPSWKDHKSPDVDRPWECGECWSLTHTPSLHATWHGKRVVP